MEFGLLIAFADFSANRDAFAVPKVLYQNRQRQVSTQKNLPKVASSASHTSVQDRVAELITTLGMTPNFFSVQIGAAQSNIHNIVSGRRSTPSFETLEKILTTFPDISAEWLIRGEGPMRREAGTANEPEGAAEYHIGAGGVNVGSITQVGKHQKIIQGGNQKGKTSANLITPDYAQLYTDCVKEKSDLERQLRESKDKIIALLEERR